MDDRSVCRGQKFQQSTLRTRLPSPKMRIVVAILLTGLASIKALQPSTVRYFHAPRALSRRHPRLDATPGLLDGVAAWALTLSACTTRAGGAARAVVDSSGLGRDSTSRLHTGIQKLPRNTAATMRARRGATTARISVTRPISTTRGYAGTLRGRRRLALRVRPALAQTPAEEPF